MKLNIYDVIIEPLITEKLSKASEAASQYGFRVHAQANKKEVKAAVEKVFDVHVESVNTMNVSGKWRRVRYVPGKTMAWKKAIVTLKKGEKIDLTK